MTKMMKLKGGPAFKLWVGARLQRQMRAHRPEGGWSRRIREIVRRELRRMGVEA